MNTKICYMYRDAANYKIHCEEIVKGTISDELRQELFDDYPMDEFYPESVGFKAPTFVSEGYKPYPDDPDCHEINEFLATNEEPTVDLTIEEFISRIKSGYAMRPSGLVRKFGLVLKEKTLDKGLTIPELTEMFSRLDVSEEMFPVDIQSENSNICAVGFISRSAYENINFDLRELKGFLRVRLFNTDSSAEFNNEYIFHNIRVHLSR